MIWNTVYSDPMQWCYIVETMAVFSYENCLGIMCLCYLMVRSLVAARSSTWKRYSTAKPALLTEARNCAVARFNNQKAVHGNTETTIEKLKHSL